MATFELLQSSTFGNLSKRSSKNGLVTICPNEELFRFIQEPIGLKTKINKKVLIQFLYFNKGLGIYKAIKRKNCFGQRAYVIFGQITTQKTR